MLTNENIVKLADFGVAKSLVNSTLGRTYAGSPVYMSPETSSGRFFEEQLEYSTHKANTDIWLEFSCLQYLFQ